MSTTNDLERIWQNKSDEDLLDAAAELSEFTPAGQDVIRAELRRRGLEDPIEQAAEGREDRAPAASEDAPPLPDCLRCHVDLDYLGPSEHLIPGGPPLEMYACPRCGRVELFVAVAEEDEAANPSSTERE